MGSVKKTFLLFGIILVFSACTIKFRSPAPSSDSGATTVGEHEGMPEGTNSLEVPASAEPEAGTGELLIQVTGNGELLIRKKGSRDDIPVFHEYIDYDCAYCGEYARTQRSWILDEYVLNESIALKREFVHLTPWGERLARAALCAEKQGKFFELDAALFANPPKGEQTLSALFATLKLPPNGMRSCMAQKNLLPNPVFPSGKAIERVPAFAIGEKEWIGIESDDFVRQAIEDAL